MCFIKLCNWHTDDTNYADSHGFLSINLLKAMNICVKSVQSVSSVCLYIQHKDLASNQNLKSERPRCYSNILTQSQE